MGVIRCRVRRHLSYRRLQHQLRHSFADATVLQLAEHRCCICLDSMKVGERACSAPPSASSLPLRRNYLPFYAGQQSSALLSCFWPPPLPPHPGGQAAAMRPRHARVLPVRLAPAECHRLVPAVPGQPGHPSPPTQASAALRHRAAAATGHCPSQGVTSPRHSPISHQQQQRCSHAPLHSLASPSGSNSSICCQRRRSTRNPLCQTPPQD